MHKCACTCTSKRSIDRCMTYRFVVFILLFFVGLRFSMVKFSRYKSPFVRHHLLFWVVFDLENSFTYWFIYSRTEGRRTFLKIISNGSGVLLLPPSPPPPPLPLSIDFVIFLLNKDVPFRLFVYLRKCQCFLNLLLVFFNAVIDVIWFSFTCSLHSRIV